jgi:tetratricopeptide (TPR) repeat protein
MKKPLKLKIVEQVVQDCRDLGIYTYCNIVMGLPGETKEDIEDGRHFLKTIHADWFGIFIANPLVGSEMFDICIDNDFLQENWIGSDYKQAVVSTDDWDSDWIQKKAYQMNLELNLIENSNYRLGDYEGALEAFERVLKTKESHPIALYMAAKCLFRLNQPEKARSYLDTVLTVCRKDSFWQSHSDYFELDVDSLNRDYPPNPVASASSNAKPSDENRHFTNY